MRLKMFNYLGGRSNILCNTHGLPLITSASREKKCQCGKKEFICCAELNCNACLCKDCTVAISKDDIVNVDAVGGVNNDEINGNNDGDILSEDNFLDSIISSEEENGVLEREDFDHVVTCADCESISDKSEDSSVRIGNNNDVFVRMLNIPTTNAGENALVIDDNGPQSQRVSGHVILNQCCTLLTQKQHRIEGYSGQKHFLERLCSTTKGNSIPLLYPEGMMYPSFFHTWFMQMDPLQAQFQAHYLQEEQICMVLRVLMT